MLARSADKAKQQRTTTTSTHYVVYTYNDTPYIAVFENSMFNHVRERMSKCELSVNACNNKYSTALILLCLALSSHAPWKWKPLRRSQRRS